MTSHDTTSRPRATSAGDTVRLPHDGAERERAGVQDVVAAVTGATPVVVTVTAVVVTRGSSPFLATTLAALRAQTVSPDTVIVVDVDTTGATGGHQDLLLGDARFVAAPRARSFGEAVDAARSATAPGTWLWLLHDDAAPAPDALAELLRAVEHSRAVAVAGAKQLRWDPAAGEPGDGDLLVSVGSTTSPLGRRMTGIEEHEIDQGQHDAREDVLAVGLAGALVRTAVWQELGGTDPELGPFGDGADLCRRARLAGHRVVVVPSAVVHHAQASLLGLRGTRAHQDLGTDLVADLDASYGARRRSQLHARLVGVPAALLPVAAVAMLVWAPFAAMYRLVVKRPGQARDELLAPLWAVLRLRALLRSRRSVRRTSTLPRRTLRPLLGTWREVLVERRDRRLARTEHDRTRTAPTQIERAELRALARRRGVVLGLVVLGLAALTGVLLAAVGGAVSAGGRLVGGSLLPAGGTTGDVWQAATSGWVATGLGEPGPPDPFVAVLVVPVLLVGGSVQTAVTTVVLGAFVAAGLGAWFAAGAVTRSTTLRAWASAAWVAAPPLLAALGDGRVGALVAHAALPWVVLGVLRGLGVQRLDVVAPADQAATPGPARPRSRRTAQPGSLGAAAGAGLALAVAVAGAPVLLPVSLVVLASCALVVRRHRRSLLLVVVPSLVLLAPTLRTVATTWSDEGWRLLLASPGVPVASDPAAGWQLLLGHPVAPDVWFGAVPDVRAGLLGTTVAAVWGALPYALGGLVLLLALAALVGPQRGAPAAWLVAAVALAAAVGTGLVTVAQGADGPVPGWAGPSVSVLLLVLGGAALLGAEALGDALRPPGRRAVLAVGAVVALALPAAGLVSWASTAVDREAASVGDLRATADPVVPPVGQQMQSSPRQVRVLSVELGPDDVVEYALLRGDGPQLLDSAASVHLRELVPSGFSGPSGTGEPAVDAVDASAGGAAVDPLPELVAALSTGTGDDVAARLGDLAVGAVLVPAALPGNAAGPTGAAATGATAGSSTGTTGTADAADAEARAELVARLDMVPGLERVTEGQGSVIWRVSPGDEEEDQPAWARVLDAAPTVPAGAAVPEGARPGVVALLPAQHREVATRVPAGEAGRVVVLAENAGTGWRATLDGRELARVEAGGLQAFALGDDGGHLRVTYADPWRAPWLAACAVTFVIVALLAVPVRRRRTGARWA